MLLVVLLLLLLLQCKGPTGVECRMEGQRLNMDTITWGCSLTRRRRRRSKRIYSCSVLVTRCSGNSRSRCSYAM